MTVKELIEGLKELPEDMEVWRCDYEDRQVEVEEIKTDTLFSYSLKWEEYLQWIGSGEDINLYKRDEDIIHWEKEVCFIC